MHRRQQILLRFRKYGVWPNLRSHIEIGGRSSGKCQNCGACERQLKGPLGPCYPHWRTPACSGTSACPATATEPNQTVTNITITVAADRASPIGTTDVQASRL